MIGPIPIDTINMNFNNNNNEEEEENDDEIPINLRIPIPPSTTTTTTTTTNNLRNHDLWQEHERRQRTIRFLMMLLMMLILMDGEQQVTNEEFNRKQKKQQDDVKGYLRRSKKQQYHEQKYGKNNDSIDIVYDYNDDGGDGGGSSFSGSSSSSSHGSLNGIFLQNKNEFDNDDEFLNHTTHDTNNNHILRLNQELFQARKELDDQILYHSTSKEYNSRYGYLVSLNDGIDVEKSLWTLVEKEYMDDINTDTATGGSDRDGNTVDPLLKDNIDLEKELVYHYPTNTTGYFRGYWTRIQNSKPNDEVVNSSNYNEQMSTTTYEHPTGSIKILTTSDQVREEILNKFKLNKDNNNNKNNIREKILDYNEYGVYILPKDTQMYGNNEDQLELLFPDPKTRQSMKDFYNNMYKNSMTNDKYIIPSLEGTTSSVTKEEPLYITESSGRLHFHFYSRSIRGMKSISLIDGYVKVHGINDYGFTNPKKHLFLRLNGVMVHSTGKISLVANAGPLRSVFTNLIQEKMTKHDKENLLLQTKCQKLNQSVERRRLQDSLRDLEVSSSYHTVQNSLKNEAKSMKKKIEEIRNMALWIYADLFDAKYIGGKEWKLFSSNIDEEQYHWYDHIEPSSLLGQRRRLSEEDIPEADLKIDATGKEATKDCDEAEKYWFSSLTQPYPFVPHETNITKKSNRVLHNKVYSNIPQVLFNNYCEFEASLNVNETQWSLSDFHSMVKRVFRDIEYFNPFSTSQNSSLYDDIDGDDALVMDFYGTMESVNCDFAFNLNATALRVDWEQTKSKVTLYSVYMMLATLVQIVILLRQIIYAQASMVATRVSMICIGWQTVLDGVLCIAHILLCLMVPPVSTAFFMVALFEFLLFYVVAMKYMAMIMEARSRAAGQPSSANEIRRRFAALQLKFYFVLLFALITIWYLGLVQYRKKLVFMTMHSFWVPQIIYNVITETKKPLHNQYIYGNSIIRLNLPLLLFGIPGNFMQEIEPEFSLDFSLCWMLMIWIGIQTGLLVGQSKYGARFMIPARFLPPKYDYSRQIPTSILPSQILSHPRSPTSNESETGTFLENDIMNDTKGPRNRKRTRNHEGNVITTVHEEDCDRPTIDCVICYNSIDIMDRNGYMLAPCDHIFHRTCLQEWMDVKMECPTCRGDLPAL